MAAEYNLMVSPRGGDAASAPLARATASYTSQVKELLSFRSIFAATS